MWHIRTEWSQRFAGASTFILLLAFPFISLAETVNLRAGFAQSAIWMSRSHVVAGESVNIFTVLYNSSENSISGDVVIEVDGSPLGAKNFTLASGETQVVSLPWIAKVGSHALSARMEKVLDAKTNASAVISDKTTGSITVSIASPPPPTPAEQVLNTVTSAIQTGFASTAPAVISAANTVYNAAESLRTQAKSSLEKQLAETSPAVSSANASKPQRTASDSSAAAATSTSSASPETPILSKAMRYMAVAGLFVVSSKTWFYISLVVMILILIQILRVAFRERKRSRRHLPLD